MKRETLRKCIQYEIKKAINQIVDRAELIALERNEEHVSYNTLSLAIYEVLDDE